MKWKMFDFPFIQLADSAVALLVKFLFPLVITGLLNFNSILITLLLLEHITILVIAT